MNADTILQPSCLTLRYGENRYLLCADEVTNFLINCDKLGFRSVTDIADQIDAVTAQIAEAKLFDPGDIELKLLTEISESLRGCIFKDV